MITINIFVLLAAIGFVTVWIGLAYGLMKLGEWMKRREREERERRFMR